jgi:hypothetical protein
MEPELDDVIAEWWRSKPAEDHIAEQRARMKQFTVGSYAHQREKDTLDWLFDKWAEETAGNRRRGMAIVKLVTA